jgi:hypothetical protein
MLEQAKKNVQDTVEFCPKCFSDGSEIERYSTYVIYCCNICAHRWRMLINKNKKVSKKKNKKDTGIIVRQIKKPKNEEKMQTAIQCDCAVEQLILKAIEKSYLLEFKYNKEGNISEKLVKPYKIHQKQNEKMLFCYSLDDDGIRLYKLDNIFDLKEFSE